MVNIPRKKMSVSLKTRVVADSMKIVVLSVHPRDAVVLVQRRRL